MYFRGTWATKTDGLSARDRATLRALYAKPDGSRVTGPKHPE